MYTKILILIEWVLKATNPREKREISDKMTEIGFFGPRE